MTRTVNRAVAARLRRAGALPSVVPVEATPRPTPPPPPERRAPAPRSVMVALALLCVYVIWGSTFLAIKVAIETIPPFTMMAIRFAIAGALLFAWAVRRGDRGGDRVTLRQWGHAIQSGALLLVGGTGLVSLAQTRISSGTAALLCATVPLWMALLGRGMLGEKLSRRAWIGLLVGFLGVAALVDPRGGGQLGAMLLVLIATLAWAAGSMRSRLADAPARPLVAASMEMLGAALLFTVIAVGSGEVAGIVWSQIDTSGVLALVYLTTAGSLVAFTAYSWLLRNASTTLVGTYAYVNPVVAVLLGWAFAGELVSGRTLVAGAVILGSVVLLITGRPGEPVPAQATSGGDVFAGEPRWHRTHKRLGGLPSAARLYRDPGAQGPRPVRRDRGPA
ncbi:EamA family transporter [Egicoccus sp. AB-alg6-2]|uniref:EamA family transporter n=1 Tax=Egicoccus sp. AB-alg6-2 TaxID=3242692 RepID=UPI00359EEFCF